MKCPAHSDKDVIGYCTECGAFGCDRCLVAKGKGENLCLKCEKTRVASSVDVKKGLLGNLLGKKKTPSPPPVAARSSVARKPGSGRKLAVHYRGGKTVTGTTYKLDPQSLGFYLVPLEPAGAQDRMFVYFSDLKDIHFVRDFEGRFDPMDALQDNPAEGQEIKVAFQDGEILEGRTLHRFDPSCQRLFIVPSEGKGNIISVLVERSALKGIEMEGFKEGCFLEEEETITIAGTEKKGRAPLSQNESMGDLYFSMKNYDAALTEYEKVKHDYPNDKRLALKISICNFNRGVNFIKSRKYLEAKAEFDKIGEDDPIHDKARKKIRKIEKILKEVQSMGT